MLKCPVCGNVKFKEQDLKADFPCPVAGCNGVIRVTVDKSRIRLWERPKGGFLGWAKEESSEEESDDSHLSTKRSGERRVEVCAICDLIDEVLTIFSCWQGRSIIHIDPYAFKGVKSLKKLKLQDTPKHPKYESFAKCKALETVKFGDHIELIDSFTFHEYLRLN